MHSIRPLAVLTMLACSAGLEAQQPSDSLLRRDLLRELVEINTSDSAGRTREAAKAMTRRLLAAGFPASDVQVIGHDPRYQNLVVRYRGTGARKPVLLMAHLDVVDAGREDWSFDPYEFREVDGWYYGRGTADNKAGAAMLVANFIRLRRDGFVPDRDLVDADFALNTDGGGGELHGGTPSTFTVQTAEKVYLSFQLEVRNRGGHSSAPSPENAICRLSEGLGRRARARRRRSAPTSCARWSGSPGRCGPASASFRRCPWGRPTGCSPVMRASPPTV
jgi:acetylornithine deacetylase/succinyl-diaminopimelate desuccinylase-like protein